MAGMIKSIFGLTTEDVREQQLKQQQAAAQQFAQQTGANQGVASFGTAVGAGLGRGLMSGLGFEDPAMVKAQEVEARQTALNEQLAALDPNDPRRQYLLAEALSSIGDTQGSLAAYASGRQMEQYQSQLAEQDRMFGLRESEQQGVAQRARANIMAKFIEAGFSPEEAAIKTAQAFGEEVAAKPIVTPDPSKIKGDETTTNPLAQQLKDLPIGTTVPIDGQIFEITKDGAVLQEKPTRGRGRSSNSKREAAQTKLDKAEEEYKVMSALDESEFAGMSGYFGENNKRKALEKIQNQIDSLKKQAGK
jgi:hypothetical protein